MKKFGTFRPSIRLGKHGKPMRDPNGHDIDITSDLRDGSDGALGEVLNHQQDQNAPAEALQGAIPAHGDAKPVNQQPAPKANEEVSLRDQLSKAFKGEDKPAEQKPAEQNNQQQQQQAPQLTKDNDGKYRLVDGTFASAEQIAAFEAAQKPAEQNSQQQQSPAMQGLTPVEQQQFQSLPAELRQYVERTMEGLNTRAARYNEYDQIEQNIIGPRRQAFAAEGSNPVVALNQLFALSDFAGRDPANFVMWFAQTRNLDLDALLDARDAAQQNTDPTVQALQGQVNQLQGYFQQQQQMQVTQAQRANLQAVETFAMEKGADGNLLRPHLTDVMDSWTAHVGALRQANPNMPNTEVLERAYQNACWSDPNVRAKMQQATQEAAKAAEAERLRLAKLAGSSINGAPNGGTNTIPNNANRSLREELEAAFAEQSI